MAKLELSPALMKLTQGQGSLEIAGTTVAEVIEALEARFPGIRARLLTESGHLQRYVSVFVGSEDVRYLDGLQTRLADTDQVSVLLALAGG